MAQIIITEQKKHIVTAVAEDFEIEEFHVSAEETDQISFHTGDIIIGRVSNIVPNIKACFVDIFPGITGYLPLTDGMAYISDLHKGGAYPVQGELILVQVEKEPTKTKSYTLTTNLSLVNRYAVLKPFESQVHISSRISVASAERERLLMIGREFAEKSGCGLILRSAASGIPEEQLKNSLDDLFAEIVRIRTLAAHGVQYERLYQELPSYISCIRESHVPIDQIQTDLPEVYRELSSYLKRAQPEDLPKLSLYENEMLSLSALYSIGSSFERALKKQVWLKSGASIVIEPTEALISIDVNTGKAIKKHSERSETFLQVNLEAAQEIARQLRLRNLSGMIIIDFLDMAGKEEEERLIAVMREALKRDTERALVVDMTGLGLMEVTRHRSGKPLHEIMAGNAFSS